jgi:protein-tyrosine-phosphatase
MDRVLFADADGTRSRIAAAVLRQHAGGRFEVVWAAVEPVRVGPELADVLERNDLPVETKVPPTLEDVRGTRFRYIIALDEQTQPSLSEGVAFLRWPFEHPAHSGRETFESVFEQIEGTLFDWLTKFEESEPLDDDAGVPPHHLDANVHKPA